jgi:hypothetical protein
MRTKSVEFHEQASSEYNAAFEWYLERSPDAAIAFDEEVDNAIHQIRAAPTRWAMGAYSTRRFLLRRFPFILNLPRENSNSHSNHCGGSHKPQARILEEAIEGMNCVTGAKDYELSTASRRSIISALHCIPCEFSASIAAELTPASEL